MKLKHIFEQHDPKEIARLIVKDCQPLFEKLNGKNIPLYRGMDENEDFLRKDVRKNRKPLSIDKRIHDTANDWFKEHFGFMARSESLFVSGNPSELNFYGNLFQVFPIGNFEFVWSPRYEDMISAVSFSIEFKNDIRTPIYKNLERGNYTNKNLKQAIDSGKEIMINCDHYYAIKGGLRPNVNRHISEMLEEK